MTPDEPIKRDDPGGKPIHSRAEPEPAIEPLTAPESFRPAREPDGHPQPFDEAPEAFAHSGEPETVDAPLQLRSKRSGGAMRAFTVLAMAALTILAGYSWHRAETVSDSNAALISRLDNLSERVETHETSITAAGSAVLRTAELDKRLAALEQKPASQAVSGDAVASLERRIAAAEAAGKAALANTPAMETRLGALEAAPRAAASGELAPVAAAAAPIDTAGDSRLTALTDRLGALETILAAPKSEARVTEAPTAVAAREPDAAALAVVAQAISRALERGDGFAAEIAAAENLGADAGGLAVLKPLARDGAPTAARLSQSFALVARAALDSVAPAPLDSPGIVDQLTAAASKLVRVRVPGETAGTGVAALIPQIEAALNRGSAQAALSAWEKLPPAAQKATEAWARDAKLRAGADSAAQAIFTSAISQLARKRSVP